MEKLVWWLREDLLVVEIGCEAVLLALALRTNQMVLTGGMRA